MNLSPSALDLGLGQGDMLRRQSQETDEERRKRMLALSQPANRASATAGLGGAVSDLMGMSRV